MKKSLLSGAFLIVLLFSTACNSGYSPTTSIMPEPFDESVAEAEDDSRMLYYDTLGSKMTNLSMSFESLVSEDEFEEWRKETNRIDHDTTNIREIFGVYAFISYFNIPDEKVQETLVNEREFYIEESIPDADYFTDDEISLLLSKDDAAIADYFIQPYAIAKEGDVYSPQWIYTHSEKDYSAAGLSPDLLEEKVEIFVDRIPFTEEAKKALDSKIETYARRERKTAS